MTYISELPFSHNLSTRCRRDSHFQVPLTAIFVPFRSQYGTRDLRASEHHIYHLTNFSSCLPWRTSRLSWLIRDPDEQFLLLLAQDVTDKPREPISFDAHELILVPKFPGFYELLSHGKYCSSSKVTISTSSLQNSNPHFFIEKNFHLLTYQ